MVKNRWKYQDDPQFEEMLADIETERQEEEWGDKSFFQARLAPK